MAVDLHPAPRDDVVLAPHLEAVQCPPDVDLERVERGDRELDQGRRRLGRIDQAEREIGRLVVVDVDLGRELPPLGAGTDRGERATGRGGLDLPRPDRDADAAVDLDPDVREPEDGHRAATVLIGNVDERRLPSGPPQRGETTQPGQLEGVAPLGLDLIEERRGQLIATDRHQREGAGAVEAEVGHGGADPGEILRGGHRSGEGCCDGVREVRVVGVAHRL